VFGGFAWGGRADGEDWKGALIAYLGQKTVLQILGARNILGSCKKRDSFRFYFLER